MLSFPCTQKEERKRKKEPNKGKTKKEKKNSPKPIEWRDTVTCNSQNQQSYAVSSFYKTVYKLCTFSSWDTFALVGSSNLCKYSLYINKSSKSRHVHDKSIVEVLNNHMI